MLKWAQNAFNNFKIIPPGTGIVHQVNLEYLAEGVLINDMEKIRNILDLKINILLNRCLMKFHQKYKNLGMMTQ